MRLAGRTSDLPGLLTALESSGLFTDSRLVGTATRAEDALLSRFRRADAAPLPDGRHRAMSTRFFDPRLGSLLVIVAIAGGAAFLAVDSVLAWRGRPGEPL